MSNKIFVSYKYYDTYVYQYTSLEKIQNPNSNVEDKHITPRSYLNKLSEILSEYAIEKWEKDDEDLSAFQDSTIESKLKEKIYDSTITIVLISPHMRDSSKLETDQWIPWEISYSLKEITRNNRTSKTNAIIAVVLPDANKQYSYCIEETDCCQILKFDFFNIIKGNFFNNKIPERSKCEICGKLHYIGYDSHYFAYATWKEFIENPKKYIDLALEHQNKKDNYKISKEV